MCLLNQHSVKLCTLDPAWYSDNQVCQDWGKIIVTTLEIETNWLPKYIPWYYITKHNCSCINVLNKLLQELCSVKNNASFKKQ